MSEWRCLVCSKTAVEDERHPQPYVVSRHGRDARAVLVHAPLPLCPGECANTYADRLEAAQAAQAAQEVVRDIENAFPSPRQEVHHPFPATGSELDYFAGTLGLVRNMAESDQELRDRILAALGRRGSISGSP